MTNTQELKQFRKILRRFNQVDHKMQVSTVLTLIEIALANEEKRDLTTKDLESLLGVMSGTASRQTYYWGDGHKSMSGAFQYIKIDFAADDRRKRSLRLTERGKYFINSLTEKPDGATEK